MMTSADAGTPETLDAGLPTGGVVAATGMVEAEPSGPTRAELCQSICERVSSCTPEVCRGDTDPLDGERVRQTCIDDCLVNESLSEVSSMGECGPVVRGACRVSGPLDEVCRPLPVPDNPACDSFAQKAASCLGADPRCLAAADVGTGLEPTFVNLCSEWAEIGRLEGDELGDWDGRACSEASPTGSHCICCRRE